MHPFLKELPGLYPPSRNPGEVFLTRGGKFAFCNGQQWNETTADNIARWMGFGSFTYEAFPGKEINPVRWSNGVGFSVAKVGIIVQLGNGYLAQSLNGQEKFNQDYEPLVELLLNSVPKAD